MVADTVLKPHIGLDLDGTLADHTAAKLFLAKEFGLELKLRETASEVFENMLPREKYRELQRRLYTEYAHEAKPAADAVAVIGALAAAGYAFSVVSRRKADGHTQARAWVQRYFRDAISQSRIFFVASDPEKDIICRREGIAMFLDDQIGVLSHLVSVSRRFLFDPFLNFRDSLPEGIMLVSSWPEFQERVNEYAS